MGATDLTTIQVGVRAVELDMIRRWNKTVHLDSLLGRRVIIIDEAQYLTKDQMGLLLTVLDQNFRCGKAVFIFTSMFDDDEITGARANEWKPLKDRCIVPPLGDVEDTDFQNAIVAHVAGLIATIGISLDATTTCKQAGFSLRAVYGRLRQEAILAGVELEESVFLGNDPEIAAKVQSTLDAAGNKPRRDYGLLEPGNCPTPAPATKLPKKTKRQKQFENNLGDNGVTILDVAFQIINEAGRPMMPIEIDRKFQVNYPEIVFVSKNPRCSINAAISKDIKLKGKNSRFVKVDRKIGLNQ